MLNLLKKSVLAKKKTLKCDQCIDRTKEGLDPACVWACPVGALQYIDTDKLEETEFVKSNADNVYLFPAEKIELSSRKGEKIGSGGSGTCPECGKEVKQNKKVQELKEKIKNKALLEYLDVCPECRSQYILDNLNSEKINRRLLCQK